VTVSQSPCEKSTQLSMILLPRNLSYHLQLLLLFTKFGMGEGDPGLHPRAKFHRCGFKISWAYSPQDAKTANFWYICATMGYILLSVTKLEFFVQILEIVFMLQNWEPPSGYRRVYLYLYLWTLCQIFHKDD